MAEQKHILINRSLLSCYDQWLLKHGEAIDNCVRNDWHNQTVSQFFAMSVYEKYVDAPCKIMFVGRETAGWQTYNCAHKASDLVKLYVDTANSGVHHNSPFWWFREKFSAAMGIGKKDFMQATLWTNLSKIDVNKTKPTGEKPLGIFRSYSSVC